jgi:glycogen(starch) synthase
MQKRKYMFTVGAGDVAAVYEDWKKGFRTPSQTSITYSSLSMDFVREAAAECLIISYHSNPHERINGGFKIINQSKPYFKDTSGIWYHLTEILYGIKLSWLAYRNGVQVIIADSGTTHWFAWSAAALVGIEIIPNFHNTYYPAGNPPTQKITKIIQGLDAWFFRKFTQVALGVSAECGRQYLALAQTPATPKRFVPYFAQFFAADFENIKPVDAGSAELTILFVGRVEENKGALDLVDIARLLEKHQHPFTIMVCGDGSALGALAKKITDARLNARFVLRGMLKRAELLQAYEAAHIVIVPTRSAFCEGLPKACAEAALAGRALVTSKLSNVLDIFPDAIIEATPDSAESYAQALERLFNNRELLQRSATRLKAMASIFTKPENSLRAALHRALPQV